MGHTENSGYNQMLTEDGRKPLQPMGVGTATGNAYKKFRGEQAVQAAKEYLKDHPEATTEVRVTDPTTGGEKGTKLARFSLIPRDFLWALAEHYGKGARKYADRNWERGYKWSLTVDALDRHYAAWLQGEDDDPETGSSHLIAVAWHVVALWWFHRHGRGTDDVRVNQGPAPNASVGFVVNQERNR